MITSIDIFFVKLLDPFTKSAVNVNACNLTSLKCIYCSLWTHSRQYSAHYSVVFIDNFEHVFTWYYKAAASVFVRFIVFSLELWETGSNLSILWLLKSSVKIRGSEVMKQFIVNCFFLLKRKARSNLSLLLYLKGNFCANFSMIVSSRVKETFQFDLDI